MAARSLRSLLAEPCAPGSEETWERAKAKFPEKDQTFAYEAAAAALAAVPPTRRESSEGGDCPNWCPGEEFDPQMGLEIINSRNTLSGAGGDGLRVSHLQ